MRKAEFGFFQGRMTQPPSKKILQFFPQKNWKKEFYYAKKYNFNFIEYFGERKFNKHNPIWNKKSLLQINKLVKKNKLSNYSFCDNFFINKNFINFLDFDKYYSTLIENLSIINIKLYVLPLIGKSLITKKNLSDFVPRLQYLANKLKYKKVKLALELDLNPKSISKLLKQINIKNVFIVYDTGNRLERKKSQYNEIIKLKKYICHFHLKDKNLKGDNVILGSGKVNFESIFKAIKSNKYKGKYTFETNRGKEPKKTMFENKNFILDIIKKIQN